MKGLGFLSKAHPDDHQDAGVWSKWKALVTGGIQDIARGLHLSKPRKASSAAPKTNELETLFASATQEKLEHIQESENN